MQPLKKEKQENNSCIDILMKMARKHSTQAFDTWKMSKLKLRVNTLK